MNYFNYLPPEIIVIIFKKLNLNDLINLRIVDKRFKEISEQIKIKELYMFDPRNNFYYGKLKSFPKFWFYTNDLTYFDNENIVNNHRFQYYKSRFQLDKNLKRLSIQIENDEFNYSILNEFKLLEHLCINVKKCSNGELNLENLKILEISGYCSCYLKLILNTNKLFAFKSKSLKFDQFVFKYPDKILFYETDYSSYVDKISIFNNLQYLKLTYLNHPIDRDLLSKFIKLKTLDLEANYFEEELRFNNLKNDINFLINQKENLKRSELQIYFNGVKLIDQNKLNQLKWSSNFTESNNNVFEFQIKNYDLLKNNFNSNKINYCDLIKHIQIIPSSFINKFPRIKIVKANDHIDNEDQFIKFLNDIPYLNKLELIDCELTKSFYKKLINLVYLNNLDALKIEEKNDLKINFNFILNLKQLRVFSTNQKINNIDTVCKLFKINDHMEEFGFKINFKNYIRIIKWCNKFRIYSYYLDDNLEEVKKLLVDNLQLKDLKSTLKNLKFKL